MTCALWFCGFLLIADDPSFPLALHRTMELDDQERALRRQHDLVLSRQAQFQNTKRLGEKGLVSREQIERERTEVKFEEAREEEMRAYRDLKGHERDVLRGDVVGDPVRAQGLLLALLQKQEAMARVEMEFRAYRLKQERALFERGATSRFHLDLAGLEYESARGNVAIGLARQAQVAMEIAARTGARPERPGEALRMKAAYLKARVDYSEVRVSMIKRRLELAVRALQAGLTSEAEVNSLRTMLRDAIEDLESERKLLEDPQAPLPPGATRFMTWRSEDHFQRK